MFTKLAIGLSSAIVIAAIVICAVPLKTVSSTYQDTETYYEKEAYEVQEPYQVEEPYTYTDDVHDTIFNAGYSVPRGFEEPLRVYLEFHGGEIVKGMIREDTGYGIDFYVFAQTGYYAWKLGKSNIPYVYLPNASSELFSFAPIQSGYYYFVLSNRNSSRDKLVKLEATGYWQETEYGYKTVTKYKTITKYRDIPKQRTVTKTRYNM